jgi:hypothetical protein
MCLAVKSHTEGAVRALKLASEEAREDEWELVSREPWGAAARIAK